MARRDALTVRSAIRWPTGCRATAPQDAGAALIVPFWTSFLIPHHALKIILDPQGYLARFVEWTGISSQFNVLYTGKAVAIGLAYNYLPLLILPVYASLERMDWKLVEAATDLGASPFKAFRQITLPLTLPGLITGALLVFIPMCGEYVIPQLLGGGQFAFVGTVIGSNFLGAQNGRSDRRGDRVHGAAVDLRGHLHAFGPARSSWCLASHAPLGTGSASTCSPAGRCWFT
jgi:hypothetical protein